MGPRQMSTIHSICELVGWRSTFSTRQSQSVSESRAPGTAHDHPSSAHSRRPALAGGVTAVPSLFPFSAASEAMQVPTQIPAN